MEQRNQASNDFVKIFDKNCYTNVTAHEIWMGINNSNQIDRLFEKYLEAKKHKYTSSQDNLTEEQHRKIRILLHKKYVRSLNWKDKKPNETALSFTKKFYLSSVDECILLLEEDLAFWYDLPNESKFHEKTVNFLKEKSEDIFFDYMFQTIMLYNKENHLNYKDFGVVMREAVMRHPNYIKYVTGDIKATKYIARRVVNYDGLLLKYVDPELQSDYDIALGAVSQNGRALKYASRNLREDAKVVLAAYKNDKSSFVYTTERIKTLCEDKDPFKALEFEVLKSELNEVLVKNDQPKKVIKV